MKAAILKDRKNMVVEEVPTPTAGPGELIVKVKYVGICGSDLHLYATGLLPPDTIMGHECTGTVAEIGAGLEGWNTGDRVAIFGGITCGQCFWCKRGHTNICREEGGIGLGDMPGAYAEYLRVVPEQTMKIPDSVSLQDAALLDPFSTAVHAIYLADFKIRGTALVMGTGPIGLCLIQQLRLAGASLIVATEPVDKRARVARDFGADLVMNPDDDVFNKLAELTDGVGVDYVFECVGIPATTEEAFRLVRRCGKVVLVGVCMEPITVNPVLWMISEISMQTTMGCTQLEFASSLDLLHKGILKTDGLVTDKISLEQVPEYFERLLTPNEEIKVLVEFGN